MMLSRLLMSRVGGIRNLSSEIVWVCSCVLGLFLVFMLVSLVEF